MSPRPPVKLTDIIATLRRPDVQEAIERASNEADESFKRFVHECDEELVGAKNVLVEVITGEDENGQPSSLLEQFVGRFLDL